MQQHSQLSKASRLRQLYSQLTGLGLQGADEDTDAALLLLLFNLANKPLQRGKLLAPQEAAHTSQDPPINASTEGPEHGSSSSEESPSSLASESDLSEWDDEGEGNVVEEGEPARTDWAAGVALDNCSSLLPAFPVESKEAAAAAASTESTEGRVPVAFPPTTRRPAPTTRAPSASAAGRLHMPAFPPMIASQQPPSEHASQRLAVPTHDDLVPCLARARLQALPFMAPQTHKCLSDQYITHQVRMYKSPMPEPARAVCEIA
jgi:hypothetical protein